MDACSSVNDFENNRNEELGVKLFFCSLLPKVQEDINTSTALAVCFYLTAGLPKGQVLHLITFYPPH